MAQYIRKRTLKSCINFIVVLIFAVAGFIKVKHPFSYFVGVPLLSCVVYLLTNAMFTDLLFGETVGCSKKTIYKEE